MTYDINLIMQNLLLAENGEFVPEEVAVYQGVIKLVQVVMIHAFQPRVPDRFGQEAKRAYVLAVQLIVGKRVDAEQADQPLVEQQLVAEIVLKRLNRLCYRLKNSSAKDRSCGWENQAGRG
jgi:hypothetical protein